MVNGLYFNLKKKAFNGNLWVKSIQVIINDSHKEAVIENNNNWERESPTSNASPCSSAGPGKYSWLESRLAQQGPRLVYFCFLADNGFSPAPLSTFQDKKASAIFSRG